MSKQNKYYNIKPLLDLDAEYNIIMGERSNGKTYSVLKTMIENYLENGTYGAYIRRYADEILPSNLKMLFNPFDIEKMTKGKYNKIQYRGKQFDIGLYDSEKDKWETREPFCFCAALNTWENAKGPDRGEVGVILFDEFLTRRYYLTNEFLCFQNVLSSFIRDREHVKVFLVGNTVSFYSPYFEEFGLEDIKNLKPGDLTCYSFQNGTKIAIDYCASVGEEKASAKFFNFNSNKANMITTGKWEIPDYPHYPKSIDFVREVVFRFYIRFDNDLICGNIVQKPERVFIYFHKQTKDIEDDENFVYSTKLSDNPKHCVQFRQGTLDVQRLVYTLITQNRIFFSDNKTGEIFNNYYKWQQRYTIIG